MLMPGEQIRLLRKERRITQEQLAEAMNVSVAAVSKWETGQSAPELPLLCRIADYFAVSVDSLLGHEIKRERLDDLIHAMKQMQTARNAFALRDLITKTLNSYPNDGTAVEACADACYALFIQHGDRDAIMQSIHLTQRLFALDRGDGSTREYELLAHLADLYAIIEDWEKAQYYYEKCSVSGSHDAEIARCRLMRGQPQQALTVISDCLQAETFRLFQMLDTLKDILLSLGQTEKALRSLTWGTEVISGLGENPDLSRVLFLLHTGRYVLYKELNNPAASAALDEAIRHAVIADRNTEELPVYSFLSVSNRPEWLSSTASYQALLDKLAGTTE